MFEIKHIYNRVNMLAHLRDQIVSELRYVYDCEHYTEMPLPVRLSRVTDTEFDMSVLIEEIHKKTDVFVSSNDILTFLNFAMKNNPTFVVDFFVELIALTKLGANDEEMREIQTNSEITNEIISRYNSQKKYIDDGKKSTEIGFDRCIIDREYNKSASLLATTINSVIISSFMNLRNYGRRIFHHMNYRDKSMLIFILISIVRNRYNHFYHLGFTDINLIDYVHIKKNMFSLRMSQRKLEKTIKEELSKGGFRGVMEYFDEYYFDIRCDLSHLTIELRNIEMFVKNMVELMGPECLD